MAIIATNSPVNKIQVPAGSHVGRCFSMIHMGTTHYEYMGQPKTANKVRMTFELPNELHVFKEGEDPKPMIISAEYNLVMSEKSNLRKMIEGWLGKRLTDEETKSFDVESLIGKAGMINIIHNDKGYADIAAISSMPKGFECPPPVNVQKVLSYDNWDENLFNSLPEFIQEKMKETVEYKKMKGIEVESTEDQSLEDAAPVIGASDSPF